MAVSNTNVELQKNNIAQGVPVDVDIYVFAKTDIIIYYVDGVTGNRLQAVQDTDYTVALDNDGDPEPVFPTTFSFTPLAPFFAKIPVGVNSVDVRRQIGYTSDFSATDSFLREKIATEIDKSVMRMQQLAFDFSLITGLADAVAEAEAAAAAATAAINTVNAALVEVDAAAANANAAAAAAQAAVGGVKVTGADTTPDSLNTKVLVTAPVTKTVGNPGANETLTIAVTIANVAQAEAGAANNVVQTPGRTTTQINKQRPILGFRGFKDGFIVTNNAGTPNTSVDIGAGMCLDASNAVFIEGVAMLDKRLDATWAAGAGAGMRNTAQPLADGTWHVYACRTAASAVADYYAVAGVAGTDPDTTAAAAAALAALNLEPGAGAYTNARRVFSLLRIANIVQFLHYPRGFVRYKTPILSVNAAAQALNTPVLRPLAIPLGIKPLAYANVQATTGGGDADFFITDPDLPNVAPSYTVAPLTSHRMGFQINSGSPIGDRIAVGLWEFTDRSAQWRTNGFNASTLYIAMLGYQDFFGQQ